MSDVVTRQLLASLCRQAGRGTTNRMSRLTLCGGRHLILREYQWPWASPDSDRPRKELFLPVAAVPQLASWTPRTALVAIPHPFRPVRRQADDLLLGREVLDREVIDLHRPRVVRANDVLVDPARAWRVVGVDLLARLVPDGVLDADHRRLARVVPADLARICAALPPRQAAAFLATLDEARAADTLALPPQPRQGAVLATLDSDRAARILAQSDPATARHRRRAGFR